MHFYDKAAELLEKLYSKKGTIKALIMNQNQVDKKLLYAIICETLKC